MKAKLNQSRYFTFLTALCALLLFMPAIAQDGGSGSSFFLLSDAAYGSADNATVRLEAQDMGQIGEYGGVDVYVYKVKDPLDFLKAQKNLHRIDSQGNYKGKGIADALARTWDSWWMASRRMWRSLFSADARKAVTTQVPEVRLHPLVKAPTPQQLNPLYQPLKAHTLVDSFRYPVHVAQPIQPPKGVKLDGSSSEFIASPKGNVLIPLGKKEPGLYLVEAMVGSYRAVTLVFVSDSIAVTKVSSKQMLVWVADRRSSQPVADAKTVWTDGAGILSTGNTDASGIANFERDAPEKTYVYGEDSKGGVFVAENYYYDSEIYNTKLYAVTDRPLYRPGETVYVKFLGRTFVSARESTPITAGELKLQVFDANGFPVAAQTLQMTPQSGGDTVFQLPDNAVAGGYELRFSYKGNNYGAAFRVAEYQKPHFEINVLPGKKDYKTNEAISGKLQLVYPDGKPVVNAKADLTVRAQRLTIVEGDLGYAGQFPVQLSNTVLTTDSNGFVDFKLPAATEPSRYVLSVLATDGAAYRVRATKEILVERGAGTYSLKAERAFSAVGENMNFAMTALPVPGNVVSTLSAPATWDWVRLENQKKSSGKLANGNKLTLAFPEPGTYTLSVRDAAGNILGATSHYVSGAGVAAPQGSIEMVFDKTSYKPGETASALITFPQQIDQALFTLERDKVEKTALMNNGNSNASGWLTAKRLSPMQWKVEIPVQETYGPNITLSVVYVKGADYVFQNLGLKVEQPRINVAVKADKAVYAPGDKVTLDLTAMVAGQPAGGSQLTVGVVDEMIYVLQPEIAPDISDFFYHPRRNNVRTSASLSFIAYDLAVPPSKLALPANGQTHDRAIKVLERPRREDKDTALWQPNVTTDATGRARLSFTMPDSLTRWRITVRATAASGNVGQNIAYVRSDKDFYVKWTSPNWMRVQDAPNASVAIFNQGNQDASASLSVTGSGVNKQENLKLKPGANFVSLPLKANGLDNKIDLSLAVGGKTVDALNVPLKIIPVHWLSQRSVSVPVTGKETILKLPADASNLQLQFADSANAQFRRLMDDLIDYPFGCVEQTSSRLIPYSLALQATLPSEEKLTAQLTQRLYSYRFRLAQMAGPNATFGWWSVPEKDGDALLTTYAYYADWHASRALKLALPDGHFDRLTEVYRKDGVNQPAWQRALMLYWMQDMGLPVRSLAEALSEELGNKAASAKPAAITPRSGMSSMIFANRDDDVQNAMSTLLAAYVVQQSKGTLTAATSAALPDAATRVHQADLPLGEALLILTGKRPANESAAVLERVRAEYPTIDRALALLWTYRAMGGGTAGKSGANDPLLRNNMAKVELEAGWQARETITGQNVFRWNVTAATPAPGVIKMTSTPSAGMIAIAQFDSREPEKSSLPVKLERRLYRLVPEALPTPSAASKPAANSAGAVAQPVPGKAGFKLELLGDGAALKTDEVYLDEVVLTRTSGPTLNFGIVEVPLPPGTTADRSTWGISVRFPGGKDMEAMERARYEQTPRGYAVPVDALANEVVVRHLVRAAQTGKFALPPARYYRMYQPDQKAFEDKPRAIMEIR
ncbi:alpha-2-macroglobulin family protein [Undibacterium sp. CY18W]|uniref:Alpha-2-macroglobulin family protein n=1 Tax=Undibacterium hunanense TaxID=2762292 RepID=A0ABR6ZT72_9BURK|nr:alpha-2-macroglobulin [Undibacterium hunanense]MBC3919075.1 alpha-2-macroglobulin family protein [Undibacterium hunanense]